MGFNLRFVKSLPVKSLAFCLEGLGGYKNPLPGRHGPLCFGLAVSFCDFCTKSAQNDTARSKYNGPCYSRSGFGRNVAEISAKTNRNRVLKLHRAGKAP